MSAWPGSGSIGFMTWSALSRAAFKVDTAHWYQRSEYISKPSSDAVSSAFWWALPWCAEQNLGNSSFQTFSAVSRARMGAISASHAASSAAKMAATLAASRRHLARALLVLSWRQLRSEEHTAELQSL